MVVPAHPLSSVLIQYMVWAATLVSLVSRNLHAGRLHVLDSYLFKLGCMIERIVWNRSVT